MSGACSSHIWKGASESMSKLLQTFTCSAEEKAGGSFGKL
jgi:hypothetical protein